MLYTVSAIAEGSACMIVFVKGIVQDLTEGSVVVEAGGIGYEIFMTGRALAGYNIGDEVRIHTWFQVREDAMLLYGFPAKDDLEVFRLLIGVNGIGPKVALGILGSISPDDLRFAILSDDVKTISSAPGVGKKTAQKLILELKDKLHLEEAFENKLEKSLGEEVLSTGGVSDARREAAEALVALGYNGTQAMKAVREAKVPEDAGTEEILRAALKKL